MRTRLIAVAIGAAFAVPAFAQTNVTIYGVADLTLDVVKASGAATSTADIPSRQRVSANSSLLGFRGTEDLGNGLNAIFQFETAVIADGSANLLTAPRDSFVGLAGGFGNLRLGNITSPARGFGAAVDPNAGSTGVGNNNAVIGRIAGGGTSGGVQDVRMSNAVRYDSPSFGGLQLQLQYGANENKNNASPQRNDNSYGAGLVWSSGPILIGGTYERRNDLAQADPAVGGSLAGLGTIGGTLATDNEWESFRLGGKLTLGTGTWVAALWDRWELKNKSAGDLVGTLGNGTAFAGAQNELERDAWLVVIGQTFGAHKVFFQYGQAREMETNSGDLPETEAKFYNLGYEFSLSKRTMVKAGWARVSNDRNAAMDFGVNNIGLTTANTSQTGADPNAYYLGLRHVF